MSQFYTRQQLDDFLEKLNDIPVGDRKFLSISYNEVAQYMNYGLMYIVYETAKKGAPLREMYCTRNDAIIFKHTGKHLSAQIAGMGSRLSPSKGFLSVCDLVLGEARSINLQKALYVSFSLTLEDVPLCTAYGESENPEVYTQRNPFDCIDGTEGTTTFDVPNKED